MDNGGGGLFSDLSPLSSLGVPWTLHVSILIVELLNSWGTGPAPRAVTVTLPSFYAHALPLALEDMQPGPIDFR